MRLPQVLVVILLQVGLDCVPIQLNVVGRVCFAFELLIDVSDQRLLVKVEVVAAEWA